MKLFDILFLTSVVVVARKLLLQIIQTISEMQPSHHLFRQWMETLHSKLSCLTSCIMTCKQHGCFLLGCYKYKEHHPDLPLFIMLCANNDVLEHWFGNEWVPLKTTKKRHFSTKTPCQRPHGMVRSETNEFEETKKHFCVGVSSTTSPVVRGFQKHKWVVTNDPAK